jgi:hypothetical protein
MKTKRIPALFLALTMLFCTSAAFNVFAADGEPDTSINIHIKRTLPTAADIPGGVIDFAQPAYIFAWVTGVNPGNTVTWQVDGPDLPGSVGTETVTGYSVGLGLKGGNTYTISVTVTGADTKPVGTTTAEFFIPDRTQLRNALNNDRVLPLSFLYDTAKWNVYNAARQQALADYNDYSIEDQSRLNDRAAALESARYDLPLKEGGVWEFLWHLLEFLRNTFDIFSGGKPQYTL